MRGNGRPVGRLASVGNSASTSYYFYNKLGYPQCSRQKTSGTPYDFTYNTTPQGEWSQIVYPSKRSVDLTFNDRGMPDSVGNYASSVTYWPHGGLNQITFGNSVLETTSYNSRLQPDTLQVASLWKLENFYCPNEGLACASNNGNVVSQRQTVGATSWPTGYTYDLLNRLTGASEAPGSGTGWSQSYNYGNAAGNMTVVDTSGLTPPGQSCGSYDPATNRCNSGGFAYDNGVAGGPGELDGRLEPVDDVRC